MQTLKFRNWDGEYMEYIHDLYWFEERMVSEVIDGKASTMASDVFMMQYSGVQDMHGTEIYEGDILSYKDASGKAKNYPVRFELGMYYFYPGDGPEGMWDHENTEVIGNIHEHPHLLKEES